MSDNFSPSSQYDDEDSLSGDSGSREDQSMSRASESASPSDMVDGLGKRESLDVWRWKLLVVIMMLFTGALVVTSSFIFLSREEEDEFRVAYEQSASAVLNGAELSTSAVMSSLFAMADAITAEALLQNSTWPFVTSSHFEIKGTHARGDSRTEIILFAPLVPEDKRAEWESYSVQNQGWLEESLALEGAASAFASDSHDVRHQMGHEDTGNGMHHDIISQEDDNDSDMQHGMDHDRNGGTNHESSHGDMHRDHEGDMPDTSEGGMHGNHEGNLPHTSQGGMHGDHEGDMPVDSEGGMHGDPQGDTQPGAEDGMGSSMHLNTEGGMPAGMQNITEQDIHGEHEDGMQNSTEDGMGGDMEGDIHKDHGGSMKDGTRQLQIDHSMDHSGHDMPQPTVDFTKVGISESIFYYSEEGKTVRSHSMPLHAPIWQLSPFPKFDLSIVNFDMMMDTKIRAAVDGAMTAGGTPAFSRVSDFDILFNAALTMSEHMSYHSDTHNARHGEFHNHGHPHSVVVAPVKKDFGEETEVVGLVGITLAWDFYFTQLLPDGIRGLHAVLENTCGQVYTYVIRGKGAEFIGAGDTHETQYDGLRCSFRLDDILPGSFGGEGHCGFSIHVYPSNELREVYNSERPELFTSALAAAILATGFVFVVFVMYVQRRQRTVMATARRTNAIVSSIFPSNVRDRIMKDAEKQAREDVKQERSSLLPFEGGPKNKLKNFLNEDLDTTVASEDLVFGSKPIADLFPAVTIMFADIVGFTAWSSVREPSQVFILLETIYHAFDQIAKKRRIFKVETVGDCYVAVAGLPDPRKDHAIVMARFANECRLKVRELTARLEQTLGPDTGDLGMRFGLHSGPVTAGVLRGERARFQLFGDTMNTASRMETTGERDQIHISEETAELLEDAGKLHWYAPRKDKVVAKGKGELDTFWLSLKKGRYSSSEAGSVNNSSMRRSNNDLDLDDDLGDFAKLDEKCIRLVKWNSEVLLNLLKQIVARRKARGEPAFGSEDLENLTCDKVGVIDEVKEIIMLPEFDDEATKEEVYPQDTVLGEAIELEVKDYVTTVAMLYRSNPFHNFEHASHVSMSVSKLLSRIVAPSDLVIQQGRAKSAKNEVASSLHDHTYGITSDPLTQFACVLSALIHDVDHCGIPNAQLIKENTTIASLYEGKSVAEQNSVDISWSLLMDPRFKNFRSAFSATRDEFQRFRELVVNSVMATDIMDKDLKALRNARWEKAFAECAVESDASRENVNRKATIVIEHLIQASDVSHTMQHWHIYRKWNERLFSELSKAFKDGRAEKDPAEFWYQGELGFFDFYIIPLAKKLADCGVFGVSSFEYLDYAERNRAEWEAKGKGIVEAIVASRKPDAEEVLQSETVDIKKRLNSTTRR